MSSNFDYHEFTEFNKKFGIMSKDLGGWLRKFLMEQAELVLKKARPLTPVDTGFMKSSWTTDEGQLKGGKSNPAKSSSSGVRQTVQLSDVKVVGKNLQVTVGNAAEYSSYIEYGAKGRAGLFILEISCDEIMYKMPARFRTQFEKFLKSKGVV